MNNIKIYTFLALFFIFNFLTGSEIITINEKKEFYQVGTALYYFKDSSGIISFSDIKSGKYDNKFVRNLSGATNFGFTDAAYWARLTIRNNSKSLKDIMLEIGYPLLDDISFFIPDENNNYIEKKTGDNHNFSSRDFSYRNFVFNIFMVPDEENTYYFRFKSSSSMDFPITMRTKSSFAEEQYKQQYLLGIYYGIALIMFLYNLLLFFYLKDKSYLYYVLYLLCDALFHMSHNGLSFQYFWPELPVINSFSIPFFIGFGIFWALNFTRSFLFTKTFAKRVDFFIKILISISGAVTLLSFIIPYAIIIKIAVLLAICFAVICIVSGVSTLKSGYLPARFYLLAWTFYLLGILMIALKNFGILPHNLFTMYGMQIGSGFELLLLTFALAARFNGLKQEKEIAQMAAIKNQEIAILNLKNLDRMKDEFLANTSHELRTPLHGIIGIADSLIDGAAGKLSDNALTNLSMISSSGKRLASLVNDILDFSKLKNSRIELSRKPVDLRGIAQFVIDIQKSTLRDKPIVIINEISDEMPLLYADEDRLQQILHNILGNAVKFTLKGSVTISADFDEKTATISVTDTGIGIPEDKLDEIFKSFKQVDSSESREFGGTGLSITKSLVEMHGGTITAKSQLGGGSNFIFTIPLSGEIPLLKESFTHGTHLFHHKTPEESSSVTLNQIAENDEKIRILAVDDEAVNLQVLGNILSSKNYFVKRVLSGAEALCEIKKEEKFDLVLLDIMMPRMSGYEVCEKIREIYSPGQLPIIMLTAKQEAENIVKGLEAGANDYITKPFSKNELLARIETHLNLSKINISYARFVPHQFLRYLEKTSITEVQLGDHVEKGMTILFTDIRSFTTMSESMTPEENFVFINSYFKRLGPVIRKNNGFIDKYIGDEIMALFAGDPDDGLRAAIEMMRELAIYNSHRRNSGYQPINIGIGVHTGNMMLGIIGESERMEGTVISDAVNLASRLEDLTKVFGLSIIVSEDTLSKLKLTTFVSSRYLGRVQVKGKRKAVSVFEVFDHEPSGVCELKNQTKALFEDGVSLYLGQNYTVAADLFDRVLLRNPNDKAAEYYSKLCRNHNVSLFLDTENC